jgi:hypothetical protein
VDLRSWSWRRIALVWLAWLLVLALGLLSLPRVLEALAPVSSVRWRVYSSDAPVGWPEPLTLLAWAVIFGPLVLLVLLRLWPRR